MAGRLILQSNANHCRTDRGVGRWVSGVDLDISNAFNSLPWRAVYDGLVRHRVPPYIVDVLGAYLRGRRVQFTSRGGFLDSREVFCGVPQGSVLGPLLWCIGYNSVLEAPRPAGVLLSCYADDTLVLATGRDVAETVALAEAGTTETIRNIESLGLRVNLPKTVAVLFHGPRRRPPQELRLSVGGGIAVGSSMTYLGHRPPWTVDGNFAEHFRRVAEESAGVAASLGRLLPNLGGPSETSEAVRGRRAGSDAVRGYRTVSGVAAGDLAGIPPFDLMAKMRRDAFVESRTRRRENLPRIDTTAGGGGKP